MFYSKLRHNSNIGVYNMSSSVCFEVKSGHGNGLAYEYGNMIRPWNGSGCGFSDDDGDGYGDGEDIWEEDLKKIYPYNIIG
jgi:hypothetical protein